MTIKTYVESMNDVRPGTGMSHGWNGPRYTVISSRATGKSKTEIRSGAAFAMRRVKMIEVEVVLK